MSLIAPGVWLGSFEESFRAPDTVTHVLNVAEECEVAERVGRRYLKLGTLDDDPTEDISRILPEALDFIDNALRGGQVFVHCLEGVSRSACVVIAWLCKRRGMAYDDAVQLVRNVRPTVDPFPTYAVQTRFFCHTVDVEWTYDQKREVTLGKISTVVTTPKGLSPNLQM